MKEVSGFKFVFDQNACEKCGGKCCIGQSGAVWVSEEEISRISEFLGLSEQAFKSRHTRRLGAKTSLVEYPLRAVLRASFLSEKLGVAGFTKSVRSSVEPFRFGRRLGRILVSF